MTTEAEAAALSPIGTSAEVASMRRAARSDAYRAQRQARADFREVAWLLVRYRMDHDLSQEELGNKVGLSSAQIARIERGHHRISIETLLRIARALDLKMVIGFEDISGEGQPTRQLVTL